MKIHFNISIVLLLLVISGCSSHPLQLTQVKKSALNEFEELPRMTVSASGFAFLGIIPIKFSSREVRARNALLQRSGGTDLIDPAVSSKYSWTPLGPFVRFTLEATPIRRKVTSSQNNDLFSNIRDLNKLKENGSITEAEYKQLKDNLLGK